MLNSPEIRKAIADRIQDAFALRATGHVGDYADEIAAIAVGVVVEHEKADEGMTAAEWLIKHGVEQADGTLIV